MKPTRRLGRLVAAFLLSGIVGAPAHAVGEPLRLTVGDEPLAAVRELGQPARKLDEARGRSRWIYGPKAGESVDVHFRKGRVETVEVQLNPPRDVARLLPAELPLVELDVRESGDARGPERWFAHPATGRIWKVDAQGRTASWSLQAPWRPKVPGKPLAQLLHGRNRKGGHQ